MGVKVSMLALNGENTGKHVNKHVLMFSYKKTTSNHTFSCIFSIKFSAYFYPPLHHNGKGSTAHAKRVQFWLLPESGITESKMGLPGTAKTDYSPSTSMSLTLISFPFNWQM